MRILHLSTRLILGGSQENTVLSCEGQARAGHDVHLAFGPIYGPEGSLLERVENFRTDEDGAGTASGITTHIIPYLIREIRPLADIRCHFALVRLFHRLQPDIIHTHSSKAGILGRIAAWRYSKAVLRERGRAHLPAIIHTVHGSPFHPYQSRAKNAIYIASERIAARRCHTIVTVCDAMAMQYLNAHIGRPRQYTTVYSGMEVEPYLTPAPAQSRQEIRDQLGLSEDNFVIGTVARLAELKGHDDLLDALAETLKANPTWRLLWVGDGWWRDRLLKRIDELGLTHGPDARSQIILTGLVPPNRVPGLMRAMDVLVHPSYREGLPRTVPQALLAGTPPIAYNLDGAPEAIDNHDTGLLVQPGNAPELHNAVQWMHDHPHERAEMARRGRETARTRFSAQTMVDALEQVYSEALQQARGGQARRKNGR